MRVLVIGATGAAGSVVSQHLINEGIPLRIAARSPKEANLLWSNPEVEVAAFDFAQPATHAPTLEGVSHLWLMAPPGSQNIQPIQQILEKTPHQLQHLILLSGRTTGDVPGLLLEQTEKYLFWQSTPYTVLRAGWFMQNFIHWMRDDIRKNRQLRLPAGQAKTAFLDLRDLGRAAHQVLLHAPRHAGKTYEIVGPDIISHQEVCRILSELLKFPVSYEAISEASYMKQQVQAGWSEEAARWTAYLYQLVRTGKEAHPSGDLQRLTGNSGYTFTEFAEDHLTYWTQ